MPKVLQVSDVRRALYEAAGFTGGSGPGAPSTAELGRWFHEGIGQLVSGSDSPITRLADIENDLDAWKESLVREAYAHSVGPRLTRQHAALHGSAPQVLAFWQATRAACHWLAELCWRLRAESTQRPGRQPLLTTGDWLATEAALNCELQDPHWSDSVRLVGFADAVVRLPTAWCAVEFKLGQTSPIADLGQACLYHLMLSNAETTRDASGGTLALVSFRPELHEQLFTAAELATARKRLIDLIGKLAGVDRIQSSAPVTKSGPVFPPQLSARPRPNTEPTEQHLELGRGLVKAWSEYGVKVVLEEPVIVGPTFIRFPITPGRGTTVKAIEKFAPELQVRQQLTAEPFISREGGRLVIDVQRPDRQKVYFDDIRAELPPPSDRVGGSRVPVGVNLFQQLVCADLSQTEHSHMLVVGTTGSGKSEWLRLALAGLMVTNTPDTLRLLVIDPKRNAFHALRASPFLWRPLVFPDEQCTSDVLSELASEMDRRYRLADGADNFAELASRSEKPLPRIVCVCDEYRDLISLDKNERKEIEAQISRLGAKARAAGIHLILATQEASRDTIKGSLDANIPARVGLRMGKSTESRMLLSENGAERLLGHGDLLFKSVGSPIRLQAPLLTDANKQQIFGGA